MTILNAKDSGPTEGGPSFSLANRAQRAAWSLCWTILAAWTPPAFHPWRRLLLRLFGATLHPTAKIYASARVWQPSNLEMGEHACLGPKATCYSMAKITLGDHAVVSQGAHLCAGTHDIDDEHFQLVAKPITLEAKSWIAAEAFVGPGVTIGEGAVLGARAVAFRDIEPWTVHIGNPASFFRNRMK
jgi:putative colanic acid biosynthesis acetyltransferase WcaF